MIMMYFILFFLVLFLIDLRRILNLKKRIVISLVIYFFLLVSGFTISFLQIIDLEPVSPTVIIQEIIIFMSDSLTMGG